MSRSPLPPPIDRVVRLLATIVDGEHPWGSLTTSVERYGAVRLRLVVYPPGIDASARRRVRAWRSWPVAGLLLGLGIVMAGIDVASLDALLVAAAVVYALGFILLAHVVGPVRHDVREVWAVRVTNGGLSGDLPRCAQVRRLGSRLREADRMHAAGRISAVDHEVVWSEVYDAIGPLSESRAGPGVRGRRHHAAR